MSKVYKVLGVEGDFIEINGEKYPAGVGHTVELSDEVAEQAIAESKVVEVKAAVASQEEVTPASTQEESPAKEPSSEVALYLITNKETGEEIEVLPHTFRDGFVDFARFGLSLGEWESPDVELFSFVNKDDSGELSSDVWDIKQIQ